MENMNSQGPTGVLQPKDGECKGCSASVHVSDELIARLIQQLMEQPGVVITSDDEYVNRLKTCQTCESLQLGTTCRWCGCLVAVKARKLDATCPNPTGSRW